MTAEHLLDSYSPYVDWTTIVICAILFIVIHFTLYFSADKKFKLLRHSLVYIVTGALANILFYKVCLFFPSYDGLLYAFRIINHCSLMTVMLLFIRYLKAMLNADGRYLKALTYITYTLYAVLMLLDCLSGITGLGFHKKDGLWVDTLVSPFNGFYLYGMLLMFVMLMAFANRLIRSVRLCLILTQILDILLIIYCGIKNTNIFSTFTYVAPVFVVMILLHSKPYNDKTGALSEDGFNSFINQLAEKKSPVDYMVLQMEMDVVTRMPDELGKVLNSFWHSYFHNATLFNIENNVFVLAIPRKLGNKDAENKIRHLIEDEFYRYYVKFQLKYKVIGLFDIDFVNNASELKSVINYLLMTMDDNSFVYSDGKTKDELKMIRKVLDALSDINANGDLEDERVLAYCQPIRNMQTGKFDSGEALMRMQIDGEFIFPNVFIPLAESYGYIHSLTRIMLNKVCSEIRKLDEEGYEFKRISINFTASEIKEENFCEEVLSIIRSQGIDPSKIGAELTESQNESDFHIVQERINTLKNNGMTFYLDDIGTGYSNLDRIVKYNVDVVKFDRFFLLEAEKDNHVGHMIKHLSQAFKDLDYKLLFEGVETQENENLCMGCGANYIQGFKYSKPIPIEEVRNFFEK